MAAYSQDLRQRVLDAIARKEGSVRQIARRFVVSLSFVVRLLQLHRRTGSIDPKPPGGGHPAALAPDDLERLQELVRQQPDATLEELRQRLGVSCSLTTIWRALEKLRLPRKKKVFRATERDRPDVQEKRRDFCAELAGVDPQRLVFVDESGANTSMTPDLRPCPGGRAGLRDRPGPLGDDHADLRTAVVRRDRGAGLRGGHEHRQLRELCGAGPGPGIATRRRGDLGQSQAAPVRGGDRGRRGGRGSCGAAAAVESGPDTDRGDVLEGQGGVEVGRAHGPRPPSMRRSLMALHDVTPEDIAGWFRDRAAYAMQP